MSGLRWEALKAVAVVMAVLLLTACSGTGTEPALQETPIVLEPTPVPRPTAEPTPVPEPTATAFTQNGGQVEVIVPKDVYEVGEVISYTFVNHSDKPIYYRYSGCDFPYIVQWVDDEEVVLVTNILDYEPRIKDIEPGGSFSCSWDQSFYSVGEADPDVQGHRYQLRFFYAFTEEDVDVPGADFEAASPVFIIAGNGEPGAAADAVTVSAANDVYQVGEDISYTIVNHSDRPIYYRYSGCDHPFIVQWVDDEEVLLGINILEYVPHLREIEPGGSLACAWDQKHHAIAGSDPEVQGHRYQVRFWYAFTEEDVDVPGGQLLARSPVFTIE